MNSNELREKFLDFFQKRGHTIIPSASLIPENDPTVLFTTAGMHPLIPFLMGENHPGGKKIASCQKCIRTVDIDEVGDQWHLTFFEMLGNWSLGDYWKKETLEWSVEFLTQELNISLDKIAVSVFEGDDDAPFDEETYKIWKSLGIPEDRIYRYGKSENWWGPAGQVGPCGPDSEIFYITDKKPCSPDCQPSCSCGKYVEIWNDVFMEYYKDKNGKYETSQQKNIDTGMGLERMVAVLNNLEDNYHCDHIKPIIDKIEEESGKKYKEYKREFRIIADHIRAATFILSENAGIEPSNLDQGYVLRRLIRRAIRVGKKIEINENFTVKIAQIIIEQMNGVYSKLEKNKKFIIKQLELEEGKFAKTLEKGLREFDKMSFDKEISGKESFTLFSTFGFPIEIIEDIAREKNIKVDVKGFEKEFKKHQEISKKGAEKKFKGGLADNTEETKKLHTATHLLQAALRQALGDKVFQKGSNITAERLRFDFSYDEKMTPKQIKKVEDLVNKWIDQGINVKCEETSYSEAKKKGAMGLFEDKYGDKVKVYSIGNISTEMCGGPHVKNTSELGKFKIKSEKASSKGVRRIKAILE